VTGEERQVLARELEYHEKLYSGFAQRHFARPAVRALRTHMVGRMLRLLPDAARARALSIGCGIGDTEILLAPRVASLHGVDLSPAAIRQCRADAAGIANATFAEGSLESVDGEYDFIFAIFFLHHLPDSMLEAAPARVARLLAPGGIFYSLDPNRYRLSGAIGELLVPKLMRKYQTPDERELEPARTAALFRGAGLDCRVDYYDFLSSPLAGLAPGWRTGYSAARRLDDVITKLPLVRRCGSNFELIARRKA
jgi:SAM-dependent methyltransferase